MGENGARPRHQEGRGLIRARCEPLVTHEEELTPPGEEAPGPYRVPHTVTIEAGGTELATMDPTALARRQPADLVPGPGRALARRRIRGSGPRFRLLEGMT